MPQEEAKQRKAQNERDISEKNMIQLGITINNKHINIIQNRHSSTQTVEHKQPKSAPIS